MRTLTSLAILSAWFLGLMTGAAAGLKPVDLRCEYAQNPLGVDSVRPRLFWKLEGGGRGRRQSAWQVLVASSARLLAREGGDLWDSGKVDSSQAAHVPYAGRALISSQQVFWKVRVWDEQGRPSSWSAPAQWTMGIVSAAGWRARWITRPEPFPLGFDGAAWIWHAETDWTNSASGLKPPMARGGLERCFQRVFELPAGREVRAARLIASIDNAGELWLNGRQVASLNDWYNVPVLDVTSFVQSGANLIAIRAANSGAAPSAAGLLLKLRIEFQAGPPLEISSGAAWRSSVPPAAKSWAGQPALEWAPVVVLAPWGEGEWKKETRILQAASLPLFRRQFTVSKPLHRALVHVSGLGHYDFFLDGQKVGNRFLDPAWSVYEKTVYYATFDVTANLRPGAHAFGVALGKGFYNTIGDRRVHGVKAGRPLKLIFQARLAYADGTEEVLVTDDSWRTAEGPVTHSAILGGEDYDARKLPANWSRAGFDDSAWQAAAVTEGPGGRLLASLAPPMAFHDVFQPVRIDEPQRGVFVYDFGQNASAVPRLRVRGQSGQTVKLIPAEQRHGMSPRRNDGRGLVNQAGVGSPNWFQYTLRGGGDEVWAPQFSYSGFQYLQLEGGVPRGHPNPERKPVVEELHSVHVRNQAPQVGEFECSLPLFNKIYRAIDWAVRANLAHVLTDCPHREKLGWLEVAYLMGPSIAGRYDISRFYRKVAGDCSDSQTPDGMVPTVAPAYPAFAGGFAYTPEWGAAAVIVPWLVHTWYGDREVLEYAYPAMRGFVDYMKRTSKELVPLPGLGDWYDYGHGKPVGASQFTPVELSAMATFYRCARVVADTAGLLGRSADQQSYAGLAAQIRDAFNSRYFDGAAEYRNSGSPQCANSMALVLGLVPPGREAAVLDRIIEDLRRRGNQQTAGDIGYAYLVEALARNGRSDVLYDIATRTNMGSYGFIVNNGWTSMPEAWDANTGASMNHCMLGHIQQWLMGHVLGIRPDPAAPGFARFIVGPEPVGELASARGSYDSIHGRIAVDWKREKGRFRLNLAVPVNTTAAVILPASDPSAVRESGRALDQARAVRLIRTGKDRVVAEVGSGTYRFEF